jgi:hypothetical protein
MGQASAQWGVESTKLGFPQLSAAQKRPLGRADGKDATAAAIRPSVELQASEPQTSIRRARQLSGDKLRFAAWNEFLPISMPTVAMVSIDLLEMAVLL